ncbi:MAG: ABC transporter ATP-binding protein [Planctomycetota bacterium]|nr:ABC transporter ATP-binding protein [Planctomycetota bacterium]MDA0934750.1 ABC transporter ATP-binding protein [Planctomycetota bacterium]MDA1222496.1 ABC transporter ATP-binding protein [Planctomycetota bacterium]
MIEFRGVSKWYGQVAALTDVSVQIDGGIVGLVGRNGAGKSTMMNLLAGLLRPSRGDVLVDGVQPWRSEARLRIGFCPDVDSFYEDLSGHAFVSWLLRLHGLRARVARELAAAAMERVGLADAMHRSIRGYSKGMRQRVKLAQALARNPSTLLLDEPMTGLDPIARHDITELVVALEDAGVTVLVSSHVLQELEEIAGRVILVHQGRLLADGSVHELRRLLEDRPYRLLVHSDRPREVAARLTAVEVVRGLTVDRGTLEVETDGGGDLFATLTALGAEGLIEEVRPLDDDLEAVFAYLVDDGLLSRWRRERDREARA